MNPKSCYSYGRSKTKVKDVVGPLKDKNEDAVTDCEQMSELQNDYFGSVFLQQRLIQMNYRKLKFCLIKIIVTC